MKQDTDWNMVSTSYDPLDLYQLIEKMTLVQTEDQYPFATVYDQELGQCPILNGMKNSTQRLMLEQLSV
jgi:hypothetical protein